MGKTIFVDFDGTITKTDTCDAMVKAFAAEGWEEISKLWEAKKLTTVECANRLFELMKADLEDIRRLVDTIEIDDYFKEFLALCRTRGYKVYILSDGYDFNIDILLKKYGIDVPFYSNRLLYEGGLRIKSPYHNEACGRCGTCKTALISKLKENGDRVIYIGDGYSDICPALCADVVFAKGVLYEYCTKMGRAAVHFDSFKDIIESEAD